MVCYLLSETHSLSLRDLVRLVSAVTGQTWEKTGMQLSVCWGGADRL